MHSEAVITGRPKNKGEGVYWNFVTCLTGAMA